MSAERHPTLRSLGIPDARHFIAARLFGMTGRALLAATIAWHVFDLTGSAFYLGVIGLVEFVPVLPVTLLGGAVADTRDRRAVLLAARGAALACALGLWAGAGGEQELWWILAMAFCLAVTGGFEHPSAAALLPDLLPREILQHGLVLNSTARNLAAVTGPVITGFAIDAAGVGAAYAVGAALFALSLASLLPVRPRGAPGAAPRADLAAIREGIAFVGRRPLLWGSMTLDMFAVIFAGATALLPVYAEEILGVGPRGYGLLAASMSIGTLLTVGVLLVRPPFQRPGRALLAAVLGFGLATILFGLSRSFSLSVLAFVVAGMADQVSVVARATILQLTTPAELRGRVNSVNMVFVGASNELGAAESGFLAALTSATFSVVAGGVACLVALGVIGARVPALRSYRVQ